VGGRHRSENSCREVPPLTRARNSLGRGGRGSEPPSCFFVKDRGKCRRGPGWRGTDRERAFLKSRKASEVTWHTGKHHQCLSGRKTRLGKEKNRGKWIGGNDVTQRKKPKETKSCEPQRGEKKEGGGEFQKHRRENYSRRKKVPGCLDCESPTKIGRDLYGDSYEPKHV